MTSRGSKVSSMAGRLATLARRVGYSFVPQLLRSHIYDDHPPPPKLYPTSWLNGVRGCAALCVFNYHFLFAYCYRPFEPWGEDDKHLWITEFPILRLPYLGLPMVDLFFLVAGYVIALQPLQLIQSPSPDSHEKLSQRLASSIFRRFFRLYLPAMALFFMVLVGVRLHLFEFLRLQIRDAKVFPGRREDVVPRLDTLFEQMVLLAQELLALTNVWQWRPYYPLHDPHLWTIPYEFRSSLILYLTLIASGRLKPYFCLANLIIVSLFFFSWDRWEVVLYLWGASMAQMDIIKESASQAAIKEADLARTEVFGWDDTNLKLGPSDFYSALYCLGFLVALFFMTSPTYRYASAIGYETLSTLIPSFWTRKEKFFPVIGATLLLWLLTRCSPRSLAHRFLTTGLVQYLAKISFSFYLVQGSILHIIGYYFPILAWKVMDRDFMFAFVLGLLWGWVCSLAITLWAADVFNREVDSRCIRLTKWIEEVCMIQKER